MGKRSTHHHFVPKTLQRQFSLNGKNLWFAERSGGTNNHFIVEWRNIRSTFARKNLYTILGSAGPSDLVETKFYKTIDDYLGLLLAECNSYFCRQRVPEFSGQPLADLAEVFWHMVKRTPDFFEKFETPEDSLISAQNELNPTEHSSSIAPLSYSNAQVSADIRN